eukprot:113878_1
MIAISNIIAISFLLTLQFKLWLVDSMTNKLVIYSITNSDQEIIAAQNLAAKYINSHSDLLSNYEIEVVLLNADSSSVTALKHAVQIISNPSLPSLLLSNSTILIPIILGCPWSSMTIMTAPALNAYNFGQISSSSTSIALSDTSIFSYFYRTIPDDSMQSAGIINLCKQFNWTTIGIIHDNDAYGIYLAVGILELSTQNNINVHAISYQRTDLNSIESAAKSIKNLNVFIIILITHGSDLSDVINALISQNIWGYPYYYIGVDSWVDSYDVIQQNISQYVEGYIGTVPWQPGTLSIDDYDEYLRIIYNTSVYYEKLISDLWSTEYIRNPSLVYNNSVMGSKAVYAWDSLYTIAYALEQFDKLYSLQSIFNNSFNAPKTLSILNDIIINHTQFLGVTGNVSFDEKGDRQNGLYGYGNLLQNGSVHYVGIFSMNENNTVHSIINDYDIVWPSEFIQKGVIPPRSSILIVYKLITINQILFYFICSLVSISTLFVIFCICSTYYFHKEPIILAISWKLNMFVCIGCLLCYCGIILYGIDEYYTFLAENETKFHVICNVRMWLLCTGFTLIFMPLFVKTFRLAKIFQSFDIENISDFKLVCMLIVCLLIDIILLTFYTLLEGLQRKTKYGSVQIIDQLQQIQSNYGVCTSSDIHKTAFYITLGCWKLLQLIFGGYVAIVVSRIGLKKLYLTKYDETGQQVFAITITVLILIILILYLLLSSNNEYINVTYG